MRLILGTVEARRVAGLEGRAPLHLHLNVEGERLEKGGTAVDALHLEVEGVELALEFEALERFIRLVGSLEGKVR